MEAAELELLPEEIEEIRDNIKRYGRCQDCGHARTFHQYAGGGDRCGICGCER